MKRFFKFLGIDRYFTVFIFLMVYLLVINSRIHTDHRLLEVLRPDAPVFKFLTVLLIMTLIKLTIGYIQKKEPQQLRSAKTYLTYFGISWVVFLIAFNLLGLGIALLFDTVSRNFNSQTLLRNMISISIDFALFGSIYLAYLFFKQNNSYRTQLDNYNKALSASAIQQLKAQLNPHFLFNNLNTLDELIEEDRTKASAFLQQFSELYRYALVTSEKKLVSLQEEIQFAKNYFELMQHKYEGYYFLQIEDEHNLPEVFVPPFCLQVLVENAIQHNLGHKDNPVYIRIAANEDITVTNNSIAKKYQKQTGGRALKNLSTQFTLLCQTDINIENNTNSFKVTLPLIKSNKDV